VQEMREDWQDKEKEQEDGCQGISLKPLFYLTSKNISSVR